MEGREPDPSEQGDFDERPWRAEDLLRALSEYRAANPQWLGSAEDIIRRYFDAIEESRMIRSATLIGGTPPNTVFAFPPLEIPHHELIRPIGAGGFGQVWLARSTVTEHLRACKIIPQHRAIELDGLKWLKQRVASHPNLFPIEEVGTQDGWIYCLMPLADDANGGRDDPDNALYEPMTLRVLLERRWRVSSDEAVTIGREIATGLDCLHARGLVHADVKPSNILRIDGRWALSDYGLLRDGDDPDTPGHTPAYTPPEGPGAQAGDVYALGVILMMLITGSGAKAINSFRDRPRSEIRKDGIEPEWQQLVLTLTSPRPDDRPTPKAAIAQLDRLGPAGRDRRRRARRAVCVGMAALATALVGSTAGILTYQRLVTRGVSMRFEDWIQNEKFLFAEQYRPVTIATQQAAPPGTLLHPCVAVDAYHGLAISQDGRVVAWGDDRFGILDIPQNIVNPVRIALEGNTAMVLQADGRVVIWGEQPKVTLVSPPPDLPPAIGIAAMMSDNALVLMADGTVRGWGDNYRCHSLGTSTGVLDIPPDLVDVESIDAGNAHWIARRADGTIRGVGCDFSRQLTFDTDRPVAEFDASESWSLIRYEDGDVRSYGLGTRDTLAAPGFRRAIDIAAGNYCGIGLDASDEGTNGSIQYWGRIGEDRKPPIDGFSDVVGVFAGGECVGVVDAAGGLFIWGKNDRGQCDPPPDLRVRLTDADLDRNGRPDWEDHLRDQARRNP